MLRFEEEQHKYFDGDVELPSVTTITRFCSYDSRTANGLNPYYRERGTLVHALTADYDFTGDYPVGTGVDGYLKGYADFKRDYGIKDWLYVEHILGDLNCGFAGTADRIGYIDGKLSIVDLKTASRVNIEALTAQLTGYLILLCSLTAKLYGLQLQKKGDYRLIPVEPDYELFNACQILHKRSKK